MCKRYLLLVLLVLTPVYAFEVEIINTDPAPVQAGEYADITVRLSRDIPASNPHENVRLELVNSTDMRLVGRETVSIGQLSPRADVTRTFRMYFSEDLPEGRITLPFIIHSNQATREVNPTVFIEEADNLPELRIGSIKTVPNKLLPDTERNKITITLQNLGEREAELIKAELMIPGGGVHASDAYSLEDSVASIPAGEERALDFTVDIEEHVRNDTPADLALRYRTRRSATESFEIFKDVIQTRIPIDDAPYLQIRQNATTLSQGSTNNKVTFTVVNNGTETAEEVRIRLFPDISYPFVFDKTTLYVSSELKPGQTVTHQAEVEVTDDANLGQYTIRAELEGLVGEALYTQDDTLRINVGPSKGISTQTLGIAIITTVILVGVGLGFYNKYNRE